MRRYLPFLIIALVALLTAGAAIMLYRVKMGATSAGSAGLVRQEQEGDYKGLHAEGPKNAPVTLELFGDFQCPPCATASVVLDKLRREYGSKLRVVYSEFPLQMHRFALPAAMAAEAAGLQDHFWEMHDLIYQYQTVWSQASDPGPLFAGYAQSLGLDMTRFAADAKSEELLLRIKKESDAGVARGVKNTPTIFINGKEVRGVFNEDTLRGLIDSALGKKHKT